MAGLVEALKNSPLVIGMYERMLNIRCRTVEAYIFVATTGRSGTDSLRKIFEAADNAVTTHEPYPMMLSDYPDPATKREYFDRLFHRRKTINIKRAAAGHRYYIETNHQFVKNFFEPSVAYFGDKLRVIHVYRDPVRVASSFYAMDSIPGKEGTGREYLLDPTEEDNLIQANDLFTEGPSFSHELYRCIWYWYEIEARVKKYKAEHPEIKWSAIATEELNDKTALVRMFNQLDVGFSMETLDRMVGARVNKKESFKKQKIDLSSAEEMHARLLEKLEARYGKGFWR